MSSIKLPPVLETEEGYTEWKEDLDIWMRFTDLEKPKQGPAVYLSLKGRARDCVRSLKGDVVSQENGIKAILAKLDAAFLGDENARTYQAFKAFHDYKRPSGTSITEFLIQYELYYNKLAQFNIALPQGVQSFFLLSAANVSDENERLARATCGDFTYKNMKSTIQKIFGDPAAASSDIAPAIKTEPLFAAEHRNAQRFPNSRFMNRGVVEVLKVTMLQ
jgi:hypothetical protein